MTSALINFRKILDFNFLLFILSLVFYIQIFNEFYSRQGDIFLILKELKYFLPLIISYIIMIVAIVPFTKNFIDLLYFLGLFSIFNIILFKLKNKSSKYISKNDYVPLYELKEKAIFYNHNVLYQNYLYHKDIKEKKMFTSKISFVNIILIVLNYFFVQNGSVNIFIQYLYINLNYDIFIISIMLVIVLMLTLFIHANKYIQPSGYSVHKNELLIKAGNDKLPENNMLPAKFSNQNIVNE